MNTQSKKNSLIFVLIAIFFCKELFWAYLVPPWQAPDELAHFGYVQTLYNEKDFPVLGKTTFTERDYGAKETVSAENIPVAASPYVNWIAQHPPLYYMLLLPVYGALQIGADSGGVADTGAAGAQSGAVGALWMIFILRLISILMACVSLFFAYKTLGVILKGPKNQEHQQGQKHQPMQEFLDQQYPKNEIFKLVVITGMAFLPGFSHISALVNNDNLVIMLSSLLLYWLARFYSEEGWIFAGRIGLLLGLLALTKITALPLWLAVFLIVILKFWRQHGAISASRIHGAKAAITEKIKPSCTKCLFLPRAERAPFAIYLLKVFGIALLISGWWYLRNIWLYGAVLPDLNTVVAHSPGLLTTYPDLAVRFPELINLGQSSQPNLWKFFIDQNFLWEYFKNFWGVFAIPMRSLADFQHWILLALFCISIAGYLKIGLLMLKSRLREKSKSAGLWTLLRNKNENIFWIPLVLVFLALSWKLYQIYLGRGFLGAMQGRYLYAVLLPFMYFQIKGILNLFDSRKNQIIILVVVGSFFVLNEAFTVLNIIIPEFY